MTEQITDQATAGSGGSPLPLEKNTSTSVTVEGLQLIIADHEGEVFAYENSCPHTGDSLDPMGGSISSDNGGLLRCQRHAAEFLSTTGECVAGPCIGESLRPVAVTIVGDDVYLD
jgi:nitrite reductase/ring-hydroxylating ferredoxin subunit